jgi:deoxyhypusine monooxygenase
MRVLYLAALQQREDSALMRHELAYILGQMQNRKACDVLSKILRDESDDVLVRHEVS